MENDGSQDDKKSRLRVERLRRSGPGGQHRNKKETAIRITDERTGVIVLASNRRSQAQNLAAAQERMAERLAELKKKRKKRKKTRPTKGSKERRLGAKKHRSTIKRGRSGDGD